MTRKIFKPSPYIIIEEITVKMEWLPHFLHLDDKGSYFQTTNQKFFSSRLFQTVS